MAGDAFHAAVPAMKPARPIFFRGSHMQKPSVGTESAETQGRNASRNKVVDEFLDLVARLIAKAHVRSGDTPKLPLDHHTSSPNKPSA